MCPKVNWNDAVIPDKSATVPDGKYLCRVKDVILKTTKTDKTMWVVWLVIESEGDFYGKILFHNLVFGDSSLWMIKLFYTAATGKVPTGEQNLQTSDLLDAYVVVTVKGKKTYEGKDQPLLVSFETPNKTNKTILQNNSEINESNDNIPF